MPAPIILINNGLPLAIDGFKQLRPGMVVNVTIAEKPGYVPMIVTKNHALTKPHNYKGPVYVEAIDTDGFTHTFAGECIYSYTGLDILKFVKESFSDITKPNVISPKKRPGRSVKAGPYYK